ncbi:MAG TPA: RNA polymerase sigma factor WhiG [Spirochaetota bacterium]|nr:RNA polymerase sigma factor WhiG [Spirochaetota bacterium]HOS33556.1 RNA polymerase sigma factor WhiG [Spirochaetota bacterium]HOS56558.1 RNA polymerase sigma factor WhiG [Spirochaetota bacterium]HPK62127.1 RNA polymerase sigma factor WhiG [Spirochaetota bacterium]HQF78863.1 RNA polymerase sigma factor WhiG [Spirochaetota bacterium]
MNSNNKLSDMNEDDIWILYKKTKDIKLRDFLIEKYAPLVKYVAGKVAMGKPGNIEYDDLVGFGVFGLMDAIEKFDLQKNVKFKTYAVTRIRGSIYDELRSIDWVPRSVRTKAKEVEQAIVKIEGTTGKIATDQEIADELNLDIREFYSTLTKISSTSVMSLSDPWFTGDDNDKISILDTIESPSKMNPDITVERDSVKQLIVNAINELPDKEKKVLVLYYYEDLTLKEIGEVLAVTESRVSQLHTKAIIRLKAKLAEIKEGIL